MTFENTNLAASAGSDPTLENRNGRQPIAVSAHDQGLHNDYAHPEAGVSIGYAPSTRHGL
jgi:hypothetical protein